MSGISWPIAAADRGQSVAGYVEGAVTGCPLVAAGLIEIERRPSDDDI